MRVQVRRTCEVTLLARYGLFARAHRLPHYRLNAKTGPRVIQTAFHIQTVNNLQSRFEAFMRPFCGPPSGPFTQSVRDLLSHADDGFRYGGLTEAHAVGLAEGLSSPALGADYLRLALDPTIDAFAARLRAHQDAGEMREDVDARAAAIQLLAPLVVARLHQDRLGGQMGNPLDVSAMLDQQAKAFVRGYVAA